MPTLLKDLIEIPEIVHKGDFVLRLSDGVTHRHETLGAYVVTEQLAKCFDAALGLIKSAVEGNSSKGAYLHGSFGSGKSHFMAVLHLLLQNDTEAKSLDGIAHVVAKYGSWVEGKSFLLVPYHLIGATSMEAAVLGGYLEHIRRVHPGKPLPAVHRADGLLESASHQRESYGDAAFFKTLNKGDEGGGDGDWGDLSGGWNTTSYAAAVAAGPGEAEYDRLVSDLIKRVFPGHHEFAGQEGGGYVSLDKGLAVISRHAKSLGYDALVLFLDELVLWLASKMADHAFVSREAPKVAKFVETATADRPIPIVSFVARQRDLREFLGKDLPGAEQFGFSETLDWWEGRFETITLDDKNLPVIAEKRVLRPRSDAAKDKIDAAFEETKKVRQEVMDVLRAKHADPLAFRRLYPFSPVFLDALVAVSSVLQRERTALKILMLVLSQQRETLELGQVVPVGDLWDVIADGEEPFSAVMAQRFQRARDLYFRKLQPLLEQAYDMSPEEMKVLPEADPRKARWRADDRVMKTMLLAALVPDVDSLKDLTAEKLSTLNHGSFTSRIPGREAGLVLGRVKEWAGKAPEVKVTGDPSNPMLSILLAGVDTEAILEKARNLDNAGNRKLKIRQLLFRQLGVEVRDDFWTSHTLLWRGTRRNVDIVFGNVRELPLSNLENDTDSWKLIIDFPFDEPGFSPVDDVERVEQFRSRGVPACTICWIPKFLSHETLADLGKLVALDHILTGDRFREQYASDLPATDRAEARTLLQGQRDQLESKLVLALESAYGISTMHTRLLDTAHEVDSHFLSLDPTFAPRPPVASDLAGGMKHVVHQALTCQFPAHPDFGADEVKVGRLRKVHDEVMRAVGHPDHRIEVEKPLRGDMAAIAQGLQLGQMGDGPFVLGNHWEVHFTQCQSRTKKEWTVGNLREWLDEPKRMGLPIELQNLVILAFAAQTNRSFFRMGGAYGEPTIEKLPNELELRLQKELDPAAWKAATELASAAFGIPASPIASAGSVASFVAKLDGVVGEVREGATKLLRALEARRTWLPPGDAPRLVTARSGLDLIERLHQAQGTGAVDVLATTEAKTSATAVGTSLRKAAAVAAAIDATQWGIFDAIRDIDDVRKEEAGKLVKELTDAMGADEYAVGLEAKLRTLSTRAAAVLAKRVAPPPPEPEPPVGPTKPPRPGRRVCARDSRTGLSADEASGVLEQIRAEVRKAKDARIDISWRVEGEDA